MSQPSSTRRLEIVAASDPTLLSRVCGILANLGLVPDRFQSTTDAGDGTLHIAIVMSRWTARHADLIERKLSQVPCVHSVTLMIGEPLD